MKGRHQPISWTRERFDALRAAVDQANHNGLLSFSVDLDRKHKGINFITEDAEAILDDLEADFAQPQRYYPPNKEGREP